MAPLPPLPLLLLALAAAFSLSALLLHSLALPDHSPARIHSASDPAVRHVEQLISETQALVREVLRSNVTLSPALLKDLDIIARAERSVEGDALGSSTALRDARDKRDQCRLDLKNEQTALRECQQRPACPTNPEAAAALLPAPVPLGAVQAMDVASLGPPRWLVVGIPTVARQHNEDYLLQTLASFAAQLPTDPRDPWYRNVLIHVISFQVNADSGRVHSVFQQARRLYAAPHPLAHCFLFSELQDSEVLPDPVPHATAASDRGTPNKPGFLVRRQTRNIATTVFKSLRLGRHYLFLEDDMQLCAQGLQAVQYLLHKASRYHPDWLAIRASYGMNGIFMRDEDLEPFLAYLVQHQRRRPPDHLVVEYYAGETPQARAIKGRRANIGFKYNIFNHLGVVSTLRSQKMVGFPTCYELLVEPTVFQVEAFSPRHCPRDDIWPCDVAQPDHQLIDWSRLR